MGQPKAKSASKKKAAKKKTKRAKKKPLTDEEKKARKAAYYAGWYARNKEKLKAQKAEKYAQDADYRQGIIDRNKEARKGKREQRVSTLEAPTRGPVPGKRYVRRVAAVNGKDEVVFTKHYMADCMGLSPVSVYEWRRKGIFPPASHLDEREREWFTQAFVDFMVKCYDEFTFARTKASLSVFRDKVHEAWGQKTKNGSRRL